MDSGAVTHQADLDQRVLWGITTYFNPSGARTRRHNYRLFRESSRAQSLPLLTVELAREAGGFELEVGRDAEILVQRSSSAVLWHKERLLNLALSALPPECRSVCWVDADVIFSDDDWVWRAIAELTRHRVIQPFEHVLRPSRPEQKLKIPRSRWGRWLRAMAPTRTYATSFCANYRWRLRRLQGTTGYAWCAPRSLLEAHGFYDRCIIGGADRELALACALPMSEVPREALRIHHPRLREHIARWHEGVYQEVRGDLGYLSGALLHLWHGAPSGRGYEDRHAIVERHDFDPERDLRLDDQECWEWAPGTEALAADVADYFAARRKDE